jgi:hypothetical protein
VVLRAGAVSLAWVATVLSSSVAIAHGREMGRE